MVPENVSIKENKIKVHQCKQTTMEAERRQLKKVIKHKKNCLKIPVQHYTSVLYLLDSEMQTTIFAKLLIKVNSEKQSYSKFLSDATQGFCRILKSIKKWY